MWPDILSQVTCSPGAGACLQIFYFQRYNPPGHTNSFLLRGALKYRTMLPGSRTVASPSSPIGATQLVTLVTTSHEGAHGQYPSTNHITHPFSFHSRNTGPSDFQGSPVVANLNTCTVITNDSCGIAAHRSPDAENRSSGKVSGAQSCCMTGTAGAESRAQRLKPKCVSERHGSCSRHTVQMGSGCMRAGSVRSHCSVFYFSFLLLDSSQIRPPSFS